MKKALLSIFSIATLVMGMTSCNKDAKEENFGFTASMEACVDQETKTVLDGINVNWENNDQIIVWGTEATGTFTATPHADNATIADLTQVAGNPGDATYYAFYPAEISMAKNMFQLPAVQNTDNGELSNFPMYAVSETRNLLFKNIFGALKINLQSATLPAVKAIEVTTPGVAINGIFKIKMYGAAPTIRIESNGSSTTRLECTTAVNIANGNDFYIALPHGNYSGLQIRILGENDTELAVKTLKAGKALNIGRSQVTNINLSL